MRSLMRRYVNSYLSETFSVDIFTLMQLIQKFIQNECTSFDLNLDDLRSKNSRLSRKLMTNPGVLIEILKDAIKDKVQIDHPKVLD